MKRIFWTLSTLDFCLWWILSWASAGFFPGWGARTYFLLKKYNKKETIFSKKVLKHTIFGRPGGGKSPLAPLRTPIETVNAPRHGSDSFGLVQACKILLWKKLSIKDLFLTIRFALRPCYVIASNKLVHLFLNERSDLSYNGLRDFVYSLFGPNILFSDAEEAKIYREVILRLLDPMSDKSCNFLESLDVITKRWMLNELTTQDPIHLYRSFKRFATAFVLQTFLGVDEDSNPELAARVSDLSTTHWHGIISVPMNVKVFSFMSR